MPIQTPRRCRFFTFYGKCKFDKNCAYLHEISLVDQIKEVNQTIELLAEKLTRMEEAFAHLESGGALSEDILPSLADSSLALDNLNITQVDGNFSLTSISVQENHCNDNEITVLVDSMQGDECLKSVLLQEPASAQISEATGVNCEFEIFKHYRTSKGRYCEFCDQIFGPS